MPMSADLAQLLEELERQKFFGSVELKFESGNLVTLKKTETLKPSDLCRERRGTYERNQSR